MYCMILQHTTVLYQRLKGKDASEHYVNPHFYFNLNYFHRFVKKMFLLCHYVLL